MSVDKVSGQRRARIHAFDTARGCAVVLVVFMHVNQQLQLGSTASAGLAFFNWGAASIRMPLLFMLSGILASGYLVRRGRDITRRAGHFAWLLIVWGVVAVLARMVGSGSADSLSTRIQSVLLPQSPLWFIWALAIFTAMIPLVARRPRGQVVATALVIACLSYTSPIHDLLPDLPVLKTARHGVFFCVGLMYAGSIVDFIVANRMRTIVLLAATGAALHAANGLTDQLLHVSILLIPEKLVLSTLALTLAASLPQARLSRGLQWLGRNTLPVFLGHMLFVDYLVGLRIDAGQFELSAGITLCSIAASICLKRGLDVAGFAWMYRLPTIDPAVGALLPGLELIKGKMRNALTRTQDAA